MIEKILKKLSKNSFQVKLNDEDLYRVINYHKSIIAEDKSSHWASRSNHKLISFKENYLEIEQNPSGFDRSYKLKFSKRNILENYKLYKLLGKKKIINFLGNFSGYAFDEKINFAKFWPENKSFFNITNIHDKDAYLYNIKKIEPFWYFNEIYNFIKNFQNGNYLEIGPGSGDLATIIKKNLNINQIFLIDLSENILFSFLNIIRNFPNCTYLLSNEIKNKEQIKRGQFIFLNTNQLHLLPRNYVDIAVNTASFGEMSKDKILEYFKLLRETCKNENIFLNINRVEKKVVYKSKTEHLRFHEYPWHERDVDHKYEICNINSGKNPNNAFIKITNLFKAC